MTPAYVCKKELLLKNLNILDSIQNDQVSVFLALKGFAFSFALKDIFAVLKGASASGLWEALMAAKYGAGHICTFSPAFNELDLAACASFSSSLITNSLAQFKLANELKPANKSSALAKIIKSECIDDELAQNLFERLAKPCKLGIRCNPAASLAPKEIYNPCGRFSRLGVLENDFKKALEDASFNPSGLHLHALCEQNYDALTYVFNAFDEKFLTPLYKSGRELEFINLGGGHHITRADYDVASLAKFANELAARTKAKIIFEPGEAIGWQCGVLRASVIDIVKNEHPIAILDVSAEAHMPDTKLMPYTSEVIGASIKADADNIADCKQAKNRYILAAHTCLAGDIMGVYDFANELKIGDCVEFADQIHYSIVKNTTFNGVRLPSLVYEHNGKELARKDFSFHAYSERN